MKVRKIEKLCSKCRLWSNFDILKLSLHEVTIVSGKSPERYLVIEMENTF